VVYFNVPPGGEEILLFFLPISIQPLCSRYFLFSSSPIYAKSVPLPAGRIQNMCHLPATLQQANEYLDEFTGNLFTHAYTANGHVSYLPSHE
jgi:hypothetical protein